MPDAAAAQVPAHTFLAFDFGEKRIGVAIGNTVTRTARAVTVLQAPSSPAMRMAVRAIIGEWAPQRLVVGLPVHIDGSEHAMTAKARRFAQWLNDEFHLPVVLADERLTTQAAQSLLKSAGRGGRQARAERDAVAAQLILQAYFDEGNS